MITFNLRAMFFLLMVSPIAFSSTWRVVDGYDMNGSIVSGNSAFEEGVYQNGNVDWVATGTVFYADYPTVPAWSYSFSNSNSSWPESSSAPSVDVKNLTINLSSLWVYWWDAGKDYAEPFIGWNVGLYGETALVDNGDATYTATWVIPAPLNGIDMFGQVGTEMSMTISASPVPLPAGIWLFTSALIFLANAGRKHKLIQRVRV